MKHFFLLFAIFLLTLPACASSPSSTSSSAFTLAPQSSIILNQPATLFSGPGNINYEKLAELSAGTKISPTGIYGDFVQASIIQAGVETKGFIWKNSIKDLPNDLPSLDKLQVPWDPMFLPVCTPGEYNAATDTLTLSSAPGESFINLESAEWSLEKPVRIKFDKYILSENKVGSIKVLGSLEGSVDPTLWWKGITAMGIDSQNGNVVLTFHDGTAENSTTSLDLKLSSSQPLQILFDQPEGRGFSVLDTDGKNLQHIDLTTLSGVKLPNGLFPQKKFYFGFNLLAAESSLAVTGLSFSTEPDSKWVSSSDSTQGLASLAQKNGLLIGTLFELSRMIDRRYCQTMQHDFNLVTIPQFNSVSFWLGPGQYDFTNIDRIVDFAARRGWHVLGSHLVWGHDPAIPDWLRKGTYTRDEYINLLKQHIQTVVAHYKGRVQLWSVANEESEREYWKINKFPTDTFHDFWYEKIGPLYVEMAFRWAKEADPSAILIFNSGSNLPPFDKDSKAIYGSMLATVKNLKNKGVPIDAVGMQAHLFSPTSSQSAPSQAEFADAMSKFSALGVRIYVTEMDVDLGSHSEGQAERYAFQAGVYRAVMDACLASGVCDGFNLWGISDALSYIVCPIKPNCQDEPNGDPLLFDRDFNPKPAYFAVRDSLAGIPPTQTQSGNAISTPIKPPSLIPETPRPSPNALNDLVDDFENPSKDGSYDKAKWSIYSNSAKKQVFQQGGILSIIDTDDKSTGPVRITSRKYGSIKLDSPIYIETAMAVEADSAVGSMGFSLTTLSSANGTWFIGCTVERYSSQYQVYCNDFTYPSKEGFTYETPKQSISPGSWHTFRIEIDPVTMMIQYSIDGVVVGSHVPADASDLRNAKFKLFFGTWKPSYNIPLKGMIAYISFGKIGN